MNQLRYRPIQHLKWPSELQFCERYSCSWQKMARNGRKTAIYQSQILVIRLYFCQNWGGGERLPCPSPLASPFRRPCVWRHEWRSKTFTMASEIWSFLGELFTVSDNEFRIYEFSRIISHVALIKETASNKDNSFWLFKLFVKQNSRFFIGSGEQDRQTRKCRVFHGFLFLSWNNRKSFRWLQK